MYLKITSLNVVISRYFLKQSLLQKRKRKRKKEVFHGLKSGSNMFHTGMIHGMDKAREKEGGGGGASHNRLQGEAPRERVMVIVTIYRR